MVILVVAKYGILSRKASFTNNRRESDDTRRWPFSSLDCVCVCGTRISCDVENFRRIHPLYIWEYLLF